MTFFILIGKGPDLKGELLLDIILYGSDKYNYKYVSANTSLYN